MARCKWRACDGFKASPKVRKSHMPLQPALEPIPSALPAWPLPVSEHWPAVDTGKYAQHIPPFVAPSQPLEVAPRTPGVRRLHRQTQPGVLEPPSKRGKRQRERERERQRELGGGWP
jgi:hypothetical protein